MGVGTEQQEGEGEEGEEEEEEGGDEEGFEPGIAGQSFVQE